MVATWQSDPTVLLRPVPELDCCLAYLPPRSDPPRRAAFHGLTLTTWYGLSMCDGRSDDLLSQDYQAAMAASHGPGTRPGTLEQALAQLQVLGLVHRTERGDTG